MLAVNQVIITNELLPPLPHQRLRLATSTSSLAGADVLLGILEARIQFLKDWRPRPRLALLDPGAHYARGLNAGDAIRGNLADDSMALSPSLDGRCAG